MYAARAAVYAARAAVNEEGSIFEGFEIKVPRARVTPPHHILVKNQYTVHRGFDTAVQVFFLPRGEPTQHAGV